MRIGIDIYGGDYAPEVTVKGSIEATKYLSPDDKLVLIGNSAIIERICGKSDFDTGIFEKINTDEKIEMGDHPAKAFAKKTRSSIVLGFNLLSQGKIDAFASAGNTGAMLVGAMQVVKSVPGVIRPGIIATVPRISENPIVLLDVGINPDCKPDVLYQYAILGSLYAEHVLNVNNPKVGLLNIGTEEEKGNLLTKTTFQAMKGSCDFNFIGNVEGNDFFTNHVDVVVCDGFVGNVVLKTAENIYRLIKERNINDEFFEKFNFENYGGTPILGINKPVIIGHGVSNEKAIRNMILHTREVVQSNLLEKIKKAFK